MYSRGTIIYSKHGKSSKRSGQLKLGDEAMQPPTFYINTTGFALLLEISVFTKMDQGLLINYLSEGNNLLLFKLFMFTERFTTRGKKLIISDKCSY